MAPLPPILLVEDNDLDIEVVRRKLKKANMANPLYVACDGVQALEILHGQNSGEKLAQPCLILLDINMPRMNGFEFLQEIRQDSAMKQNIVFMLTTSARNTDVISAYNFNAAGYFLKENIGELVDIINDYCQFNQFPGGTEHEHA